MGRDYPEEKDQMRQIGSHIPQPLARELVHLVIPIPSRNTTGTGAGA